MTHPCTLIAATTLGLVLALGTAGCADSSAQVLEKARTHIGQRQYEPAILLLKTHLQDSPKSGQGRFLFGQALLASGDAAGAEVELRRALEHGHPKTAVVPVLAQAMFRQAKHQALLESFGAETLGDAAADQDLGTTLAQALAASGQLDAARARLQRVLSANPPFVPALLAMAQVQSRGGEVDAALATLDGLLQRAPGNVDGWQARGDLLRQKGDLEGAAAAYARGLAADPKEAGLHSSLIAVHYLRQDSAAAERQFLAMKEVLPKHALTRYQEAIYSFQKGDFATAAERLQPVVLAFPERVDVLWLAGAVDLQRGALTQAEAHLVKVVALQPALPVPRRLLAQLHLRTNQPHKALAVVRPAADQTDADAETLTVAAYAALLAADTKGGRPVFRARGGHQSRPSWCAHRAGTRAALERPRRRRTGPAAVRGLRRQRHGRRPGARRRAAAAGRVRRGSAGDRGTRCQDPDEPRAARIASPRSHRAQGCGQCPPGLRAGARATGRLHAGGERDRRARLAAGQARRGAPALRGRHQGQPAQHAGPPVARPVRDADRRRPGRGGQTHRRGGQGEPARPRAAPGR
jgi:predicted Zn-dependent protease